MWEVESKLNKISFEKLSVHQILSKQSLSQSHVKKKKTIIQEEKAFLQFFFPATGVQFANFRVFWGALLPIWTVYFVNLVKKLHHIENHAHRLPIITWSEAISFWKMGSDDFCRWNPYVAQKHLLVIQWSISDKYDFQCDYESQRDLRNELFRLVRWGQRRSQKLANYTLQLGRKTTRKLSHVW